jgi:hypothetical protein
VGINGFQPLSSIPARFYSCKWVLKADSIPSVGYHTTSAIEDKRFGGLEVAWRLDTDDDDDV